MPARREVIWYVEPLDARTSLAIADFLESGADVELHQVSVGATIRSLYRLPSHHQLEVLEETRAQLGLTFNIVRERGGKKEDITAVMRSRHRAAKQPRPAQSLERLIAKGAVHVASSLGAKKNGRASRVRS